MTTHIEPHPVTEEVCVNCSHQWRPTPTGRCAYCGSKTTRERFAARSLLPREPEHGWSPSTDRKTA